MQRSFINIRQTLLSLPVMQFLTQVGTGMGFMDCSWLTVHNPASIQQGKFSLLACAAEQKAEPAS
jgi:hypothetical protein